MNGRTDDRMKGRSEFFYGMVLAEILLKGEKDWLCV